MQMMGILGVFLGGIVHCMARIGEEGSLLGRCKIGIYEHV